MSTRTTRKGDFGDIHCQIVLRATLSKILIFRFHPELELADNFGFVEKCGSDSYFIVWFVNNIP